jgi:CheY-like chemotaxis protein
LPPNWTEWVNAAQAAAAEEAIRRWSRRDVVLLDIGLPGMDGYEVAKRLRERPDFKDVTMCALTGYPPSEADRHRQQETGFDHYYVKPVSLAKLLELFKMVGQPAS